MKQVPMVKKDSFLMGSAKLFLSDPLKFMYENFEKYGETFQFKAGPKSIYIFTAPEEIKDIFATHDDVFVKERGPRVALGKTVLTSEGETWKRQRKYAQQFFTKKNIESAIPQMEAIIRDKLTQMTSNEYDLHQLCVDLIYKLVIKIIFGLDDINELPDLVPIVNEMIDFVRRRPTQIIKTPLWVPTRSNKSFLNSKARLFEHMGEMLTKAEKEGRTNLLSVMAKDSNASHDEIMNQALTFFVASFETTANSLFWTLYLLLKNNDFLKLIENEVQMSQGNISSLADLEQFHHLQLAIKESMRMYPPAWFRSRLCIKDTQIGDYYVPKGSTVWAAIHLAQRHPNYWDKPNLFNPQRFEQDYNRFSYIPFGGGKNLCIGKSLSIIEISLCIKEILSHFEFTSPMIKDINPKASITLGPIEKLHVKLRKR